MAERKGANKKKGQSGCLWSGMKRIGSCCWNYMRRAYFKGFVDVQHGQPYVPGQCSVDHSAHLKPPVRGLAKPALKPKSKPQMARRARDSEVYVNLNELRAQLYVDGVFPAGEPIQNDQK